MFVNEQKLNPVRNWLKLMNVIRRFYKAQSPDWHHHRYIYCPAKQLVCWLQYCGRGVLWQHCIGCPQCTESSDFGLGLWPEPTTTAWNPKTNDLFLSFQNCIITHWLPIQTRQKNLYRKTSVYRCSYKVGNRNSLNCKHRSKGISSWSELRWLQHWFNGHMDIWELCCRQT